LPRSNGKKRKERNLPMNYPRRRTLMLLRIYIREALCGKRSTKTAISGRTNKKALKTVQKAVQICSLCCRHTEILAKCYLKIMQKAM
jgi:hypothetical protein